MLESIFAIPKLSCHLVEYSPHVMHACLSPSLTSSAADTGHQASATRHLRVTSMDSWFMTWNTAFSRRTWRAGEGRPRGAGEGAEGCTGRWE